MSVATTNPPAINQSLPDNKIVQLREWGTNRVHPFPARALRCLLGTADDCPVRLSAPGVLPMHAQLARERQQWLIRALGDTPGLRRDGARCNAFLLQPGVEIGVGNATLVAENEHWIALRSFCARILGFGDDHMPIVDRALRSIRMSLTHRVPLLLCGESDLVPIAHALHRWTVGPDQPFVVCDPYRRNGKESVRSATNYRTGAVAVKMAIGGSLCVRRQRLPRDFSSVLAEVRESDARVQLIVCSNKHDRDAFSAAPIRIPSLQKRQKELSRIVDEYALDAIAALNVPPTSFINDDRVWVLRHAARRLPEIEKATLRLVALRASRNRSRAAERLGMAMVSLSRWMGRRI